MNWYLERLPSLNFESCADVLAWVEAVAPAADRRDVEWTKSDVLTTFEAHGWHSGANCGDEFRIDDARNYAGWIVGQWLSCGYPAVATFAKQWRERFALPTAT